MQRHHLGELSPVSALTLGGGGLGQVWGETTFEECVATVHAAVEAGIDLLDLAPRYGDGKAEEVVGAAFGGRLPEGVRVTSKCNLGELPPADIEPALRRSIEGSLRRLRLSHLDLFFLHSNVVPNSVHRERWPDAASRMTLYETFAAHVRPVFDKLVAEGLIGAWGVTGIGHPDTIVRLVGEPPTGGGAMHRQSARLAGCAEILRRPGQAARNHCRGAGERGRHHGHSRGSGRCLDQRARQVLAIGPSRDARLCACRWLSPPGGRAGDEPCSPCSSLRIVARGRHAGARGQKPR